MPDEISVTAPEDAKSRIFVALDTGNLDRAAKLATALAGEVGGIKVGKELFTAHGPDGVRAVAGGEPLFLDLKFHDIPNTVAGAVRAASHLRPFLLNVHASGGRAMMVTAAEANREAAEDNGVPRPLLLGVTVLTSLAENDLAELGLSGSAEDQVKRLAVLAQESGLDGVVCSPKEIAPLRALCGAGFLLVVPGIRPSSADAGDQKRIMTPAEALAEGADYLVIGRPITAAPDPVVAARKIISEIGEN